jgi:hypothetical protein
VGAVEYGPTRWEENGSRRARGGRRMGVVEHAVGGEWEQIRAMGGE